LRSSLRCFFLAMRLRRFLTTEPIDKPFETAEETTTTASSRAARAAGCQGSVPLAPP
jgi:hypothetical protein